MREEEEVKPNTEFIAEIVTIVIENKEIANNKDNFLYYNINTYFR
jgi:hypothetical protein